VPHRAKDKIAKWRWNPVAFVQEAFGATPSPQQEGLLWWLVKGKDKGCAIRSGHGTGKSTALSWTLMWFLLTRPGAKILATAPSRRQLRDILWAEISVWHRRAIPVIRDMLEIQAEKITVQGRGDWFARAVSINTSATAEAQGEALAGYHHDHFMAIIDEASGVPDPVFQPVEGFLTRQDNYVIMASNPTQPAGYFYRIFNDEAFGEGWTKLHWNSEESPLVDRTWVERMRRKYGEDSDTYRIRVLGEFPLVGSQELIPMTWIRACIKPGLCEDTLQLEPKQNCYWGLDVARFGADESVLVRRYGMQVYRIDATRKMDTIRLADWVLEQVHTAKVQPDLLFVDVSGGIGVGCADILRQHLGGMVIDVNVSVKAFDDRFFMQSRDEMYWKLRRAFDSRLISILPDETLIRQLSSLRYDQSPASGKTKIASKKAMRSRGLPSPDRADALALTFFYDTDFIRQTTPSNRSWRRRKGINLNGWKVA